MKTIRRMGLVVAICSGFTLSSVPAWSWTLDFEAPNVTLPGQQIDDEYSGFAGMDIQLWGTSYRAGSTDSDPSTVQAANPLTVYDTTSSGHDSDLESPFVDIPSFAGDIDDGGIMPGNILILQEYWKTGQGCDGITCSNPDDIGQRPAGSIWVSFSEGVQIDSIDFFDIENAEDGGTNNMISFFSDLGASDLLATSYTPDTNNDNTGQGDPSYWDRIDFNVGNVRLLEIRMGGSGAIDNISFSTLAARPVPEPGTLLLFTAGLLGLAQLRRVKSV